MGISQLTSGDQHWQVDTMTETTRRESIRLHEARVTVRDRRRSGVGLAFSVGDRVEHHRGRQSEGWASDN